MLIILQYLLLLPRGTYLTIIILSVHCEKTTITHLNTHFKFHIYTFQKFSNTAFGIQYLFSMPRTQLAKHNTQKQFSVYYLRNTSLGIQSSIFCCNFEIIRLFCFYSLIILENNSKNIIYAILFWEYNQPKILSRISRENRKTRRKITHSPLLRQTWYKTSSWRNSPYIIPSRTRTANDARENIQSLIASCQAAISFCVSYASCWVMRIIFC